MKSRLVVLGRVAASLAVLLLVGPQHVWALYRQPTAVTVVDWILAVILVFLPAYIFLKVKFASLVRFRISLLLVLLNVLVWLGAQAYGLYIEKTVEGFAALGPLHRVDSILVLLWQRSIPLSVLVICFLSRRAKTITLSYVGMLVMFCAVELALNYGEIHRYLTTTEQANYKDFKDILAIRNYLSASGMTTLRLYPRERTKKVLVSALESDDWTDRHDAAIGLQYVRARATIPHLVGCLHRQDETDTYDQAREACAVALEILLSGRRDAAIYSNIEEEFEKDRAMLFRRLEEQALRSSANL